jgi:hypothetical protein
MPSVSTETPPKIPPDQEPTTTLSTPSRSRLHARPLLLLPQTKIGKDPIVCSSSRRRTGSQTLIPQTLKLGCSLPRNESGRTPPRPRSMNKVSLIRALGWAQLAQERTTRANNGRNNSELRTMKLSWAKKWLSTRPLLDSTTTKFSTARATNLRCQAPALIWQRTNRIQLRMAALGPKAK